MAAARQSARKRYPLRQTRHVTRETARLRRGAVPGWKGRACLRPFPLASTEARGEAGAGETPTTPQQRSVGPHLEWTKPASSLPPPRLPGGWGSAPGRALAEGRSEPSARTAPERDLRSSAVAPAGVDVSYGNAEMPRVRSRWAGCLAAGASPPLRSGRRQPPGGIAQPGFTCKNAVPGIPSRRLFPRVTRGTFHPRHPPGDFLGTLISKPMQRHIVLAVLIATDFLFFKCDCWILYTEGEPSG